MMAHSPINGVAKLPPVGHQHHGQQISARNNKKMDGLTGPVYQIAASPTAYKLPPPSTLKPHFDTKAGVIETWPAHASGHNASRTSVVLSRTKDLVVVNDDELGKPQIIPKPRFLDQLEGFLKKELRSLGCSKVGPNELRLQAHREVFEYLIEDFKTYKPLLSAIKNEYEMVLAYQREVIRQMDPLKQMLVTVSERCDQKIMAMREQEKQDIVELKRKNMTLHQRISDMRNEQKDLETQVSNLKAELSSEYERYRDECDARKLLVSDINDLRYQQEDMAMSRQGVKDLDDVQEDPVMLKIALKKAREDEAAASSRLMEMEANYGDVIPRRDFEALEATHKTTLETLETLQDDFDKLKQEHDILLDTHTQVIQQRDEYFTDCERMRVNATPRPDWDKCCDFIVGGAQRWAELSQEKSSNEKVDILLNEIIGGNSEQDASDTFDPRGVDDKVPKFLRTEEPVKNRRLGKRDCALLVKDVWKEKLANEETKTMPMEEYLFDYLTRRFGIDQLVLEWGYNLLDASHRFSHDERFGNFHAVLSNEMAEELFHQQVALIRDLYMKLVGIDEEKQTEGKLSKEDFRAVVTTFFPELTDEQLGELMVIVDTELDSKDVDVIEFKNLFLEDDEGKTGAVMDDLKKKLKQRRYDYVNDIKERLQAAQLERVSVDNLKKAFTEADPEIDQARMDKYLCWAFKAKQPIDLTTKSPMDLGDLIIRLQNGDLTRVGAKV